MPETGNTGEDPGKLEKVENLKKLLEILKEEYICDIARFGKLGSELEGYAVLRKEVDALWDEIKKPRARHYEHLFNESKRVAAAAIRFMVDICIDTSTAGTDGACESKQQAQK